MSNFSAGEYDITRHSLVKIGTLLDQIMKDLNVKTMKTCINTVLKFVANL